MQVKVPEEDHIVDHEAEKGPHLVLRGQHELLVLVVHDGLDLGLDLAGLLLDKVGPWEFLLDALVESAEFRLVRVCVEDMDGEPAGGLKFDDLQGGAARGHCHAPRH